MNTVIRTQWSCDGNSELIRQISLHLKVSDSFLCVAKVTFVDLTLQQYTALATLGILKVTAPSFLLKDLALFHPCMLWCRYSLHHSSPSSSLARFSTARRQVAANEGGHGAPVIDSSYLLEDPVGPMDLDDSPCRGYAAASPEGDERSYEVRRRGHYHSVSGPTSFEDTGAHTWSWKGPSIMLV